jgi:hypothetical protein
MLEVWGRKNANQVIQVLWTLSELGVEYKRHSIGTESGDLETENISLLTRTQKYRPLGIMVLSYGSLMQSFDI